MIKQFLLLTALIATQAHGDILVRLKDGTSAKIIGDLASLEIVASTPPPPPPPPPVNESPSGTTIPPATEIIDGNKSKWTVKDGVVYVDGKLAGFSANVTTLLYYKSVIYQQNAAGGWWGWNGTTWLDTPVDPRTPPPPVGKGWSTQGNKVLSPDGKEFHLLGVHYWPDDGNPETEIPKMKDAGFNGVRLQTTNRNLDSQLALIDRVAAAANKVGGFYLVIDNHANEGISEPCWAQQANGLWYDLGPGTDGTDGCGIKGTVTHQRWVDDWKKVAQHFKGNPAIWGYDLRNEPLFWPNQSEWGTGTIHDIRKAYIEAGNAILSIDPNVLIIVEGDFTTVRKFPVTLNMQNKVVYSMHDYPRSVSGIVPDSGQEKIDMNEKAGGFIATENIAPIFIGEFAWDRVGEHDAFAETFVNFYPKHNAHYTYFLWNYHADYNPKGLNAPGGLDQYQMKYIARLKASPNVMAIKAKAKKRVKVFKPMS